MSDAVKVHVAPGWELIATGASRQRGKAAEADIILQNDAPVYSDRVAITRSVDCEKFAMAASEGEGRPSSVEIMAALHDELLAAVLESLQDEDRPRKTQSDLLVEKAAGVSLFHCPEKHAYATVTVGDHSETWRIRSKQFQQWIRMRYHEEHDKVPGSQAVQDALGVLEGSALFDGPEMPVYRRVAGHRDAIYLDLCNDRWQAVRIDAAGWDVVDKPPVKFTRARGTLALPVPAQGGQLSDLRDFLNLGEDVDWALVAGWLVACLRPTGPYPVLALHGEQGSAKSTTSRALRALVDPNAAPIRSEPREVRDLMITASNSWMVVYDNLSRLPMWLSDALCRMATGGGFATRELYSDSEESIFNAQRPVVLNGIEELAIRSDLLDRSIMLYLPTIPSKHRRTEADYWKVFDEAQPRLLGALLSAVSRAIRDQEAVTAPELPRMADFALWAMAAEPAFDLPDGLTFLDAYTGNRESANTLALESVPIVKPLTGLLSSRDGLWSGTAAALLQILCDRADPTTQKQRGWPKDARSLSNVLRTIAPNLRAAGITVSFGHEGRGNDRRRVICLEQVQHEAFPSSPGHTD